jgi:dienelactone hydrolase
MRENTGFRKTGGLTTLGAMKASLPSKPIKIHTENLTLHAILQIPPEAKGIIVFAHGSGSGSMSPRNRLVARLLLHKGFAVLLPDLTGGGEEEPEPGTPQEAGHVERIATRLTGVIDWLCRHPRTRGLRIGLFGARGGAGAAMIAAARRPAAVRAVISRGGRPDLAQDFLEHVQAPTLMIVGANDSAHIAHNRRASGKMPRRPMLELIEGANHLFGEPGALEQVATMSCLWFRRNLGLCG